MNITASQIRQDFSCFGEFGQQGYGYNVEELRAEIRSYPGRGQQPPPHHDRRWQSGPRTAAELPHSPKVGLRWTQPFDVSPAVIGTVVNNVPGIRHVRARSLPTGPPGGRGGADHSPVRGPGHRQPPHQSGRQGLLELYQH